MGPCYAAPDATPEGIPCPSAEGELQGLFLDWMDMTMTAGQSDNSDPESSESAAYAPSLMSQQVRQFGNYGAGNSAVMHLKTVGPGRCCSPRHRMQSKIGVQTAFDDVACSIWQAVQDGGGGQR
jgi:hypothetical protein